VDQRILTTLVVAAGAALALPGASFASQGSHRRLSGVVRSVDVTRDTVTVAVDSASRHHRSKHPKLVTLSLARAKISDGAAALAVGDSVTVTTGGHAGHTLAALDVEITAQPPAGGEPEWPPSSTTSTHVTGQVTAVRGDGFTISVDGALDIVSVTSSTSFDVTDVNGDGRGDVGDLSVGDMVYVQSYDASASPIVARGVLDYTHPLVTPS
jgi:hypothetical protein